MVLSEDAYSLRIFIGESDMHEGLPLYQWLINEARRQGLSGATVLRGFRGFGAHNRIHNPSLLHLSRDSTVILEIVDKQERIDSFLTIVNEVVCEGLVTSERVRTKLYCAGKSRD